MRGFWNVLKPSNPVIDIMWRYRLQRHDDWIEHYVSLVPDATTEVVSSQNRRHVPLLDFYEYYWDMYVDHGA